MTREIELLDLFSGIGGFAKGYRRLTEIEFERLQGFPDNWTQFGIYDEVVKPIAQTNRYKLVGNAVTTNFPKMIAQKLIENYNL